MFEQTLGFAGLVTIAIVFGLLVMIIKMYRKVDQGKALVRNGMGGAKVNFTGMLVLPVIHKAQIMDISVKRIEIERSGKDGLICADNMRADIKVVFFVRVNKTVDDVLKVAQALGCERASDNQALIDLFDAKFSEALKTVGKRFEFTELYAERDRFKTEILQIIGTDLNGYVMDDCAIDYLEQTSLAMLSPDNILDSQGIKKITEITAQQKILANKIQREKEKTITQQDVEAREAILELNRQLAETEEKQKREVATVKAREEAETAKVQHEERLKAEQARIQSDEEIQIAEENKNRQVLVAAKNRERTDAVETQRVDKDKLLEEIEKNRIVELARFEKDKALEEERKNIQEVIKERVTVEKTVVEEEEKIKDTKAFAEAQRQKEVAIVSAEKAAQEAKLQEVIAAEAAKEASERKAAQQLIEADADQKSAQKKAEAMKTLAEARAVEEATIGMSEVNVMEAKADAIEKQGLAEATVLERKAQAEAHGIEARAAAQQKEGVAQARVMEEKYKAEAQGIEGKAAAMKKLDGVGKEHEEFKLRLDMRRDIELARIGIQKDIAQAQAEVIKEGLKAANIDIVGGDNVFFDKLIGSITNGKSVDRLVNHSKVLTDIKDTFFNGNPENFAEKLRELVGRFGLSSEDLKNLTISALVAKLIRIADDDDSKYLLQQMSHFLRDSEWADKPASVLNSKIKV